MTTVITLRCGGVFTDHRTGVRGAIGDSVWCSTCTPHYQPVVKVEPGYSTPGTLHHPPDRRSGRWTV